VAGESAAQIEARRARLRLVFEMFAENGRIADRAFAHLVRGNRPPKNSAAIGLFGFSAPRC
jgi:hypothetical protein